MTTALAEAGLDVERVAEMDDLDDIFAGFGDDLAELEIRDGKHTVRLQLARFDRHRTPVVMDIGFVLHLDDVLGSKVAALATRAEPRDYIDVAAALRVRTPDQLGRLAQQADTAVTEDDLRDAMVRLDRLDDSVFVELYGLGKEEVAALRAAFSDWPRGHGPAELSTAPDLTGWSDPGFNSLRARWCTRIRGTGCGPRSPSCPWCCDGVIVGGMSRCRHG